VIGQSYPAGTLLPKSSKLIFWLARVQERNPSLCLILLVKKRRIITLLFEIKGMKISDIKRIPYPGLGPGIIIKQSPASGFQINSKARISIEVSQ